MAENDSIYFVVFVYLFLKLSAVPKNPTLVTSEEKYVKKIKKQKEHFILILYRLGLGFLFVFFHFTHVPTARFSGCSAGVPGFNVPVVFAFI